LWDRTVFVSRSNRRALSFPLTSGVWSALSPAVSTVAQPAVCGDATRLPFPVETFDLVFSQNVLLWISKAESVVEEVCRILVSGGVWLLFEPDYGGMIEYPVEASSIWVAALKRAGANPLIGRQLPFFLDKAGFRSRIELLSRILPAAEERFDFLEDLPLTNEERNELAEMRIRSRELSGPRQISHLPYFLIIAERA